MDLSRLTTGRRYRIGRVGQIPIYITLWLAILAGYRLFVSLIYDGRPDHVLWMAILFLSILLHELGHAAAAKHYGHRILGITFHLFGGLMEHQGKGSSPRQSAVITIAGPAVNMVLLGLALLLEVIFPAPGRWGGTAISSLHMINLILLIFNVLPVYPLDGGKISRLVLSKYFGPVQGVVIGSILALVTIAACFGCLIFWGIGGLLGILLLTFLGLHNYDELEKHRKIARSMGLAPPTSREFFRTIFRWKRRRKHGKITDLLDKASREGMESLSNEEQQKLLSNRHKLHLKVAKEGYEGLSTEEKTILDVHHLLENRDAVAQ